MLLFHKLLFSFLGTTCFKNGFEENKRKGKIKTSEIKMKNMRQGTKGDEGNTPAACPISIFSCLSSGTRGNMPGPFPGPPPNRCGYLTKC